VDVDAFATEFFAYRNTTAAHQILRKCSPDRDTCRKRGIVVGVSHSERSILEAKDVSGPTFI
jgi:hypothetical protein